MNQLKCLVLDIETAPMLAYVWERKDQNIGLNQIKSDWYVLAWSAKWLGDPPAKIMYRDQRAAKNIEDDRQILEPLRDLLDEADFVVTQNGKNFDAKKLNARFIIHGMMPPKPYKHKDTYQIVSKVAKFTSNSLEYLTNKLCTKYRKLSHKKFPGMSLWTECLNHNKEAWEEMKKYNMWDVLSTEELYLKIRSWEQETKNTVFVVEDPSKECGTCGSLGRMQRRGEMRTKKALYPRYCCQLCGTWQKGEAVK